MCRNENHFVSFLKKRCHAHCTSFAALSGNETIDSKSFCVFLQFPNSLISNSLVHCLFVCLFVQLSLSSSGKSAQAERCFLFFYHIIVHFSLSSDAKACFLPEIPHARVLQPDAWYPKGDKIRIQCDEGYEVKNFDATAVCSDGTWMSVPHCESMCHTQPGNLQLVLIHM